MKLTKILGLTTLAIVLSACVPRNDTIYIDADEPRSRTKHYPPNRNDTIYIDADEPLNSPQEIEILEPPIIDIE